MNSPDDAAELTPEQRQWLENWLRDFDQRWEEAVRLVRWVPQLPDAGPLRRAALVGMIKIDMRRRWLKGRQKLLEDYLRDHPELGTPETVSPDLVVAELHARQQAWLVTVCADLAQRFPRQGADLPGASETGPKGNSASQSAPPRDRYTILKELGRGTLGMVYLALDNILQRKVAMKIPHFQPSESPEGRQHFLREARAAAMLNHPNICPIYDIGEHAGIPFVTMAYIEGKALDAEIRATRLFPQVRAAKVACGLARGLEEAHSQGLIHRNLKPGNVMMNRRDEPVLMDLGLARQDVQMTHQGSVLGTPAYMSPEQVRGDLEAIGPPSDQYSLGVILYQMLTGQVPFQGSIGVVMTKILTEAPRPLRELRPEFDPALEKICLRALAKDIRERYPSMADFAAALSHWLEVAGKSAGR